MDVEGKIKKLLENNPDPRKGAYGKYLFMTKKMLEAAMPCIGVVEMATPF